MTADHYAALGLAANASLADIKKAFRQKASFYHPIATPHPTRPNALPKCKGLRGAVGRRRAPGL